MSIMVDSIIDTADDYPFYVQDKPLRTPSIPAGVEQIPQGPGSTLDSDTVDGLQAVRASKAGPNKLVATGSDGRLPATIAAAGPAGPAGVAGPAGATGATGPAGPVASNVIYSRDGSKAYTLYVDGDGALYYAQIGSATLGVTNRAGTLNYRVVVEADGALAVDPA